MYAISESVLVNPPGARELTRAQMWKGLVMKAENAVGFVSAMMACEIIERFDDGFLRRIDLRGDRMFERITFTPEVQVHFERVRDAKFPGWITNVLSDSAQGLVLTFTFAIGFPGAAAGSADEKRQGDAVRESYLSAVGSTIARARELVVAGDI
jgi:Domain of unknown function (DUF1857)